MVANRIIVATGLAVFGALLMSGCTMISPTHTSAPHATQALVPLTPTQQANQLLATVIAPPGATEVAAAPNSGLQNGGMVAGCTPRTDVARYWTVANTTPQRVIAFLHAHASKDFGPGGIASVRQGKRLLQLSLYSPSTQPNSNSSLSYVVMRLDSQTVGVSAKVDFIAPDATCTRFALLATASTTS